MWFVPFQRSFIVTALTAQEIKQRLEQVVRHEPESQQWVREPTLRDWSRRRDGFAFSGELTQQQFRIFQDIGYQEHFLPLIVGSIEESSRGCLVVLRFSLFPGTLFFMLIATAILGALVLIYLFIERNIFSATLILLLWVGLYGLINLIFAQKVRNCHRILDKVLA